MPDKPIKVVVVDDEESITRNMSKYLTEVYKGEFEVIETNDSLEVMPILEKNQDTQVIISDFQMPNLNGFELLLSVKKKFPSIYFIMMTGFGTAELRDNARKSGAVQYVEKPFNIPEIAQMIRELVNTETSGFTGFIDELELSEIVQFLNISSSDVQLTIETPDDKGILDFSGGELIHAETSKNTGEQAFYEIFLWKGGQFSPGNLPKELKRTIFDPIQGILLDAARLEDEQNAIGMMDEAGGQGNLPEEKEAKLARLEKSMKKETTVSESSVDKETVTIESATDDEKPQLVQEKPERTGTSKPIGDSINIDNVSKLITPIVDNLMLNYPRSTRTLHIKNLLLQKLPSIIQKYVEFRLNQISRSVIRFDDVPFDHTGKRIQDAVDNLIKAIKDTWEINREFFRSILEEAVEFNLLKSIDLAKTMAEFLVYISNGDCDQIQEYNAELIHGEVFEDSFGFVDLQLHNDVKSTLESGELENIFTMMIQDNPIDITLDTLSHAIEWIFYFASFVPQLNAQRINYELIASMAENRNLDDFNSYLDKMKNSSSETITLEEYYELVDVFRSNK
ncbi:response regulator [Calditrichota bacterium]